MQVSGFLNSSLTRVINPYKQTDAKKHLMILKKQRKKKN